MTVVRGLGRPMEVPWAWTTAAGVAAGLAAIIGWPAVVALVAIAGAGVVWRRIGVERLTEWIPAILGFLVVTDAPSVATNTHGIPPVMKIVMPILAVWGVARSRSDAGSARDLPRSLFLIALFPAAAAISVFGAVNADLAGENVLSTLGSAVLAAVLVLWVRSAEGFRVLCYGVAAGSIFLGVVNAMQGVLGTYDNTFFGFAVTNIEEAGLEGVRVGGSFGDGNYLSQMVLMGLPIAGWVVVHARRLAVRLAAAVGVAAMVAAVALSLSRGGLLALGAVIVSASLFSRWRGRWLTLAVVAAILGALFAPPVVVDRATTIASALTFRGQDLVIEDPSARGRINEMASAVLMWRDSPVTGVGAGNYEALYLDYSSYLGLDPRRTGRSAHSLYLETLAETGVVGLSALFLTLGGAIATLWAARRRLRHDDTRLRDLVTAVQLGFLAYLVAAVFLHDAYEDPYWLLIGLGLSASVLAPRQAVQHRRPLRVLHVLANSDSREDSDRLRALLETTSGDPPTVQHRFLSVGDTDVTQLGGRSVAAVNGSRWGRLRELIRQVRAFGADVIHLHRDRASGIVGIVGVALGIPVVLTTDDGEATRRRALGDVMNWLTVERILRTEYGDRNAGHVGRVPTEFLPNVVEDQVITARPVRDLQRRLPASSSPILITSTPDDPEAAETVMTAFDIVARRYPNATLLVTRRDRPSETALPKGSRNRVVILDDDVELATALAVSHLVVEASTEWSDLRLIRQGLAAGLCVIATDVGDSNHFVDEEFGILIDPLDAGVLARAIAFAFSNPGGLMRRGQLAKHRTMEQYGPEAWARRVRAIYEDVDDGRTSAATERAHLLARFR